MRSSERSVKEKIKEHFHENNENDRQSRNLNFIYEEKGGIGNYWMKPLLKMFLKKLQLFLPLT